MLNRIVAFLTGYLLIIVRGPYLEKFINLMTNSGLRIWDVKWLGEGVLESKIRAGSFLRCRHLFRQVGVVVKIHRKTGWPFLWQKMVKRKTFFLGAVGCLSLILYLSTFVWVIRIDGLRGAEKIQLQKNLAKSGLYPGISREKLLKEKRLMEQETILRTPKASWLGISLSGVVANVRVIPRKTSQKAKINRQLVANSAGVVQKVITIRGTPLVKEGDSVVAGDLLIDGVEWYLDPDTGELAQKKTAAVGRVIARVWEEWEIVEPRVRWQQVWRKKVATEYKVRLGRRLWSIISLGQQTAQSKGYRWRKTLYQSRNPLNNVEIIKDVWYEHKWQQKRRSLAAMKKAALKELQQKQHNYSAPGKQQFVSQSRRWILQKDFLKLQITVELLREIAVVRK